MNEEQKQRIIKYVEFVLEPIGGKFIDFDKPHDIYVSIGPIGGRNIIMSEENRKTVYPMKINTDFGEIRMTFWSDELNDPRWPIVEGCAYNKYIVPNEEKWQEINRKISELYLKGIE
jgi:hypothetical protein